MENKDKGDDKYKIKVIDTEKHNIPQKESAKSGIMPRYPFSWLLSGCSGSGKTNLLLNILTRNEMYGSFFHYIVVFSPTAGTEDDSYKALKLPKENFIKKFDGAMLQKIIDKRKEQIRQKGIAWVGKNSRMLIIMDDVIADKEFLKSPEALKMFTLLRHYLVSIIILLQKYNKLPPALRTNCNAICVFPSKQNEIECLIDEITPSMMAKRDFEKVIDYCTKDEYSFLYVNFHAKREDQIRKNLSEILTKEDILAIAPPKDKKNIKCNSMNEKQKDSSDNNKDSDNDNDDYNDNNEYNTKMNKNKMSY